MLPKPKEKYKDSAVISAYRQQIQNEISKGTPNEDCIVEDIIKIAEEMYKGVDIKNTVTAQIYHDGRIEVIFGGGISIVEELK